MKKIILINSSCRKKNTYSILKKVEELLQRRGYQTEIMNLSDYSIFFCRGCELCIEKGFCPLKDDVETIKEKLSQADGIVVTTPVYLNNISGLLKTFLDRTCSYFHRSDVYSRPTLLVLDTMGSGLGSAEKALRESLIEWGAFLSGSIKRNVRTMGHCVEEKEIKRFIELIEKRRAYHPSYKEVATFSVQKALGKKVFPLDGEYWSKKGLDRLDYYPGSHLSFLKRIYSKMLYAILLKSLKRREV